MKRKFSLAWRGVVALVLICSLGLVFATPAAAQVPTLGVLISVDDYTPDICDPFTVTATVTATDTVNDVVATITVDGRASLATEETWTKDLGIMTDEPKDAVWVLHCDGPGDIAITVDATGTNPADGAVTASDSDTVSQPKYVVSIERPAWHAGPPLDPYEEFTACDNFYVNATVANTTDTAITAGDNVNVTLTITSGPAELAGDGTSDTVESIEVRSTEVADFWWELHCTGEGSATIEVKVTEGGSLIHSDTVTVNQEVPDVLVIDIVEPEDEAYICTCEDFVVKAHIVNVSSNTTAAATDVTITLPGCVSRVPADDPLTKVVGDMAPGAEAWVQWTLHCDTTCDKAISVDAGFTEEVSGQVESASVMIHQRADIAALGVTILEPEEGADSCAACGKTFTVTALVENEGCEPVTDVSATISPAAHISITPPLTKPTTPSTIPPGGTAIVEWEVECTTAGSTSLDVDVEGTDAQGGSATASATTVDITQKDLIVEITQPQAEFTASTCQNFDVIAEVSNCTGSEMYNVDVTIDLPLGMELAAGEEAAQTIGRLCACCTEPVSWTVHCENSTDGDIKVTATKGGLSDDDTVLVAQEWKAHLMAGIETFPGTLAVGDFYPEARHSFYTCQDFTLVVSVANMGEADAESVDVTVGVSGNATPSGMLTATIANVPGFGSAKAMWDVHCDAPGDVIIEFLEMTGSDENTGAAISADNIEPYPCPLTVTQEQAPSLGVNIIQPDDGATFNACQNFVVKAEISNTGVQDIVDLTATIDWGDGEPVELISEESDTETKGLGALAVGATDEVAWTLHCTGAGDANITVTAGCTDPLLLTVMDAITVHQVAPADLTVEILSPAPEVVVEPTPPDSFTILNESPSLSQTATLSVLGGEVKLTPTVGTDAGTGTPGEVNTLGAVATADLSFAAGGYIIVEALLHNSTGVWSGQSSWLQAGIKTDADSDASAESNAPASSSWSLPDAAGEVGEIPTTYIATSQDFALTAQITNSGSSPITIDTATVTAADTASVLSGPTPALNWTLDPGQSVTPTWTLHCAVSGTTTISLDISGTDTLGIPHTASDSVGIEQYPAAHLEVQNISVDKSEVTVSENFTVTANIKNTGEADAWEVSAILSVFPEGSARIVDGGYTKTVGDGTLVGHGQDGNAEVSWTLHCKVACESTITIAVKGYDEYGWHLKPAWSEADQKFVLSLESEPGRAIEERFIEPASVTVKQEEPSAIADLAATKVADPTEQVVGEDVTFTITVTNNGPAAATTIWVSDVLPAGLNFKYHTRSQGFYYVGSGHWTVGDLAFGESATLEILATVNTVGDIHNLATVIQADQHDPDTGNNADVVMVTGVAPEPVTEATIELGEGYNLISLPLIPDTPDIETMMTGLDFIKVSRYVNDGDPTPDDWLAYNPPPAPSDLDTMDDGWGYWINMNTAGPPHLTFTGSELVEDPSSLPPSYYVLSGWNLIGFKSTVPKPAAEYLAGIADKYVMIYGYDGTFFVVGAPGHEYLQPNFGYWLALKDGEEGTIYP